MKNFLQEGEIVRATAPYTRTSGQGAKIGRLFGVATMDVTSGAVGDFALEGVFEITKASGAWTEGATVYWDDSAKNATLTAAGNMKIGVAVLNDLDAMALSGDATGRVRLDEAASAAGIRGVADGYAVARGGAAALDGSNPTPIATGLATIVAASVQLRGTAAPGDNTSVLTTDFSGSDGTLNVYAWKNTGGTDPTLVASTGTETFDWIAFGTL